MLQSGSAFPDPSRVEEVLSKDRNTTQTETVHRDSPESENGAARERIILTDKFAQLHAIK